MCGIVSMIGYQGRQADPRVVERMTASLVHRGPDQGATWVSGSVGLGFRRLSILDLSPAAHQPMVSDDGNLILVFNGEIFNYVELRAELQALGHRFESSGDTEVLLQAYREWGVKCLDRLNGMWAFLIYDVARRRLFGSRDRFGIKPLYCYQRDDYCLFASEIKAVLASGLYSSEPDWETVAEFLFFNRLDESASTFHKDIKQIPAGTTFEWDLNGTSRLWRYWSLDEVPAQTVADPVEAYAELFEDTVRLHMRSDVPVGVCLSGGLDSTSILCATARGWNGSTQPLLAFSYNAAEFDESLYVADTIRHTSAELKRLETDPRHLWDTLGTILAFQDEPVQSMTPLVGFELMRLAAESGVKVVLNGQGSDEVLAGYAVFFRTYWYTLLRGGDARGAWRQIRDYAAAHGGDPRVLAITAVKDVVQNVFSRSNFYRRAARWKHRTAVGRETWFTRELAHHLRLEPYRHDWTLDAKLKRAVEISRLPLFLRVEDRNSMAHSLEARLPFLDYRLVSLSFNLAPNWKMRGPWNKFVLRQAMRQRIPESVRSRVGKMGFPVPQKQWFANALYERVSDLVSSQEVRERGIYNLRSVQDDLRLHRHGSIDASEKLFRLAQFETWWKLQDRASEAVSVVPAQSVSIGSHDQQLIATTARGDLRSSRSLPSPAGVVNRQHIH